MFVQPWSDTKKEGEFEFGSFVPPNLISEKERKSNLKKWDAYQNKLLKVIIDFFQ